jgi:6-phosphogluconolactonase
LRLRLAQAQLIVHDFRIYPDAESVAQAGADYIGELIAECVDASGTCHVALPGGSTPARCLELLSRKKLPWQKVHWYLGDERCYPAGHPERNDTMIEQQLWSRIEPPPGNIHPIPGELGPEMAAERYAGLIVGIGGLDIVVLGMGEDGHTASLFPGNPATASGEAVVAVYNAPKPPPERVSLGLGTLRSAQRRVVLVSGGSKREAMAGIMRDEPLPVNRIGPSVWFVDQAAADKMDTE